MNTSTFFVLALIGTFTTTSQAKPCKSYESEHAIVENICEQCIADDNCIFYPTSCSSNPGENNSYHCQSIPDDPDEKSNFFVNLFAKKKAIGNCNELNTFSLTKGKELFCQDVGTLVDRIAYIGIHYFTDLLPYKRQLTKKRLDYRKENPNETYLKNIQAGYEQAYENDKQWVRMYLMKNPNVVRAAIFKDYQETLDTLEVLGIQHSTYKETLTECAKMAAMGEDGQKKTIRELLGMEPDQNPNFRTTITGKKSFVQHRNSVVESKCVNIDEKTRKHFKAMGEEKETVRTANEIKEANARLAIIRAAATRAGERREANARPAKVREAERRAAERRAYINAARKRAGEATAARVARRQQIIAAARRQEIAAARRQEIADARNIANGNI